MHTLKRERNREREKECVCVCARMCVCAHINHNNDHQSSPADLQKMRKEAHMVLQTQQSE